MAADLVAPVHQAVNSTGQAMETVGVVVILSVIAVAVIRLRRATRSWAPLCIVVGALVASFEERIYNVTANLWYFQPGQKTLYRSFGGGLPVWVALSYGACYGGLGTLLWWMVKRGLTRQGLYRMAGAMWGAFALLEIVNIKLGTYAYYGRQPFRLGGFPLWIPMGNVATCIVLAVAAAHLEALLTGRRVWGLVVLGPAVVAANLFGTTFPMMLALHASDPAEWFIDLMAVAAVLLAVGMIWLVAELLPSRRAAAPTTAVAAAEAVAVGSWL